MPPTTRAARREQLLVRCGSRLARTLLAGGCLILLAVVATISRSGSSSRTSRLTLGSSIFRARGKLIGSSGPPPVPSTRPLTLGQVALSLATSYPVPPTLLDGETIHLAVETVHLTGAPPLLSRADINADGPDFQTRGCPIDGIRFKIVDPDLGSARPSRTSDDNPYRYVVASEDAIKDIFIATLASSGRRRPVGEGSGGSARGPSRLTCKASPVTAPWWCRSALAAAHPQLRPRVGEPLAATGGVPDLWVLDAGFTSGGYYGLLSAALGIPALLVDPQPQCGLWTRTAADASGIGAAVVPVVAFPDGPLSTGFVPVRARTGCVGTSSVDFAPALDRAAAKYDTLMGGRDIVRVPRATLDSIVAAAGLPERSVFLIVKVDVSGREGDVLRGMEGLLRRRRVLSLIVEVNKQQLVRRAPSSGSVGGDTEDAFDKLGYDAAPAPRSQVHIDESSNANVARTITDNVRYLFSFGFEMLTADRGWWSAQDPYNAETDAADRSVLDAWALKVMLHGEIDLFFYLPDSFVPGGSGERSF